ncbi:hypothetical protein V495_08465 [Pseudogymnoascus sp. VKM F-4514 (FW-929)]|nr:hypothetical protein V490_08200 [Pseudogymnoascus sp. VKM F-3557]KFY33067.1 hypothetical protein V495_08465 [Pseudogymnoascus sp. VKM F-4514 (FW-929)]KFY62353.1 hypothetical protein V497_02418 [Pseudogymnoascus sp. VKM F-4516 (FW-969)]
MVLINVNNFLVESPTSTPRSPNNAQQAFETDSPQSQSTYNTSSPAPRPAKEYPSPASPPRRSQLPTIIPPLPTHQPPDDPQPSLKHIRAQRSRSCAVGEPASTPPTLESPPTGALSFKPLHLLYYTQTQT